MRTRVVFSIEFRLELFLKKVRVQGSKQKGVRHRPIEEKLAPQKFVCEFCRLSAFLFVSPPFLL